MITKSTLIWVEGVVHVCTPSTGLVRGLRIHWATTGLWVNSTCYHYISWLILHCIVRRWWQYDHRWGGFWHCFGLRLISLCSLANCPVHVIASFFDMRLCEMPCIGLHLYSERFVCHQCNMIHSTVKHLSMQSTHHWGVSSWPVQS